MKRVGLLHPSQHTCISLKSSGSYKYSKLHNPLNDTIVLPPIPLSLLRSLSSSYFIVSSIDIVHSISRRGCVSRPQHRANGAKGSRASAGHDGAASIPGASFKGIPGSSAVQRRRNEMSDGVRGPGIHNWSDETVSGEADVYGNYGDHVDQHHSWKDRTDDRTDSNFSDSNDDNDTNEWSKDTTDKSNNKDKEEDSHFEIQRYPIVMPSRPAIPKPLSTSAAASETYLQQIQIEHRSYKDTSPLPQVPWLQDSKKTYLDDAERAFGRKEDWHRIPDHGARIRLILLLKEFITDTVKSTNDIRRQTLNERRSKLGRLTSEFASYMVIGAEDPSLLRKWRVPLSAAEIIKQEEEEDMKPYIAERELREMSLKRRQEMEADQSPTDGASDTFVSPHASNDISILNNSSSESRVGSTGGSIGGDALAATTTAHIGHNTDINTRPIMDSLKGLPATQDMDIDASMEAISPNIPISVLQAQAFNEKGVHQPYRQGITEKSVSSEPYYHQYPFLRKRAQEDRDTLDPSLVDWTQAYFPTDAPDSFNVPREIDIRYRAPEVSADTSVRASYTDDYDNNELEDADRERKISHPKSISSGESHRLMQEKKKKYQQNKRILKSQGKGQHVTADADGVRISRQPSLSLRQSLASKVNQNLAIFDGEGMFYKRSFNNYTSDGSGRKGGVSEREMAMLDSEGIPKAVRPRGAKVTTITDVRRCILGSPERKRNNNRHNNSSTEDSQRHQDKSPRYYGLSDDTVVKMDWNTSVRSRRGFTVPGLNDAIGPKWHQSNERLVRVSRGESPDTL
eukprot:Tbor_TRINITY_DN3139_c0_g1::TRINITY_DN3139_c0_g1_i1::g.14699::m.14699